MKLNKCLEQQPNDESNEPNESNEPDEFTKSND